MIQRMLDVLISIIAIVLLLPFLLPVVCVLRFTGEGEIFYTQERVGRGGRPFGLLKFATMMKNSPNIGAGEITLTNDPRVLPIGKFLRKTKINELPQIWNIFVGHMSLVGPRPMVPNTFKKYPERDKVIISEVRPGLTGIGSLVFRDEEQILGTANDPKSFYDTIIIPYKSKIEVWYVNNISLRMYITIIAATAWVVVFPKSSLVDLIFPTLPERPSELT